MYDRYADTMFAISRRYARDYAEAQDFAQEAWVRVFAKLHTFKFKGSLEGWIRRVTVTTALRGLERRGVPLDELPPTPPASCRVDPEAISRLGAEELLAHIAALPDGYRRVFNLHAVEGYSHDEIADLLKIKASTSRSQLTKARSMLQRRIQSLIPCL